MKLVIALVAILSYCSVSIAQTNTCKSLQTGKFKITTEETGTTYITRTKDTQIEENKALGVEIVFDIKWLDDCTYELRPKKLIKGDPWIMGDGTHVLKTTIKNITDKTYVAETSSNFSEGIYNFTVEIIESGAITPNFSLR